MNKRGNAGEHTDIYQEIGDKLGEYYDNMYKMLAIFAEEERRSRTEVYTGDASLGKRALQRVLMKKQLEQMSEELRRIMIYESPPELGALWTEVEAMMKQLGKEQETLIARQMQAEARQAARRAKRMRQLTQDAWIGVSVVIVIFFIYIAMALVVQDRIQKYPQLGTDWMPKTPAHRQRDSEPQVYVGR
jgi:Fe2+ transport system protein B